MAHTKGYLKIKYLVRSDSIPIFLIFFFFTIIFQMKTEVASCLWWNPFLYTERFYSISFKTFYSGFSWSPHRFGVFFILCTPNPPHCPQLMNDCSGISSSTLPQRNTAILTVQKWNTAFDVARVFDPTVALKIKTKALAYTENWLGASGANYVLLCHTQSCPSHAKTHSYPPYHLRRISVPWLWPERLVAKNWGNHSPRLVSQTQSLH